MKNLFFLLVSLFNSQICLTQNYCSTFGAFLSPSYPSSISVSVVNVDTIQTYYNQEFYTKLKIARPIGDILPFVKRPLIIGVHGGGFISDSIGMSATDGYLSMFNNMNSAAQYGYIGASLDYRTGFGVAYENILLAALVSPGFPACNTVTPEIMNKFDDASYRATYDCLKAIDYVCKNSSLFPYIDTSQIYLYGSSAGAIVVLNAIFSELNEFTTLPLTEQTPFPQRHKISAAISLSGAVNKMTAAKLAASTFEAYNTPLFLAHGNKDSVVSNSIAPLAECTNLSTTFDKFGSTKLSNIACSKNIPHQLFIVDNSGHDLGASSPVSSTIITSSFTFLYNSGICPSYPTSIQKLHGLDASLISTTFCENLGFRNEMDKINFGLYPNPTATELNLILPNDVDIELSIVDLEGRILKTKTIKSEENFSEVKFNIESLTSGMYFVVISQGNSVRQKAFVKM